MSKIEAKGKLCILKRFGIPVACGPFGDLRLHEVLRTQEKTGKTRGVGGGQSGTKIGPHMHNEVQRKNKPTGLRFVRLNNYRHAQMKHP